MRTVVPGPCPVCNTETEFLYQTENIPYFSDILIISALCPGCGYRYVDTQVLSEKEPSRWQILIERPEDLLIRVVRSTKGVVMIPELGVRIDPGPACEGFITNVEGVIDRIERIVDSVLISGDEEERRNAFIFKERAAEVRSGALPVTLIIEDASGNSMIISERAMCSEIPAEGEAC